MDAETLGAQMWAWMEIAEDLNAYNGIGPVEGVPNCMFYRNELQEDTEVCCDGWAGANCDDRK